MTEWERVAFLNRPPAPNDERLLRPTRCRALRAFYVNGKVVLPGSLCELPFHLARDMAALHRCEILELNDGER